MVDQIVTEEGVEMGFGDSHTHCGPEPLTEGAGGHFDPRSRVMLRVSGGEGTPLSEVHQILFGHRKTAEMEHCI